MRININCTFDNGKYGSLIIDNVSRMGYEIMRADLFKAFKDRTLFQYEEGGLDMSHVIGYGIELIEKKKGWFS